MRKAPGKGHPFPAPFSVRRTGRMRIREPVYPHGGPDTDDGRKMTDCRKSLTNSLTSYIMDPSEVIGMVFRLLIDRNCVEEVTATVHEQTALINEIERLVLQDSITDRIPGYEDDTIVMIPVSGIECFMSKRIRPTRIVRTRGGISSKRDCMSLMDCCRIILRGSTNRP